MKKYIAVVAAVVVVLGAFSKELGISLPSVLSFINIQNTPIETETWQTFEEYINAAKTHDIETLAKLSYQLSPACKAAMVDETKLPACYELMDSVAYFAGNFKQSDFKNIAYDDRQVVLSTDFMGDGGATKTVVFFVRESGLLKMLGISFCFGGGTTDECVNTDPKTRDVDHDGWWDDVESLFKK